MLDTAQVLELLWDTYGAFMGHLWDIYEPLWGFYEPLWDIYEPL